MEEINMKRLFLPTLFFAATMSSVVQAQSQGTTSTILTPTQAESVAAIGSACYCSNSRVTGCTEEDVGGSGIPPELGGGGCGAACGGGPIKRGLPPNFQQPSSHPSRAQLVKSANGFSSGSVIMNPSMEYIHYGWDLKKSGPEDIGLLRLHRPVDYSVNGSFGPGVFTNFDKTLFLSMDGNGEVNNAELFDPATTVRKTYHRGTIGMPGMPGPDYAKLIPDMSYSLPGARESLKSITLLNSSMNPITTNNVSFVSFKAYDNSEIVFKVFDIGESGARTGKVSKITSSLGASTTITYKTWTPAELAASPTRALQVDKVTDRYGKELVYSYLPTQQSGTWVVSQIATPRGNLNYSYSNGKLNQVQLLSGAIATFTAGTSPGTNCTTIDIVDPSADTGHRNKKVYLNAQAGTGYGGYAVTIPLNGIRMILNGNNEVAFLSSRNTASDQFHYEGAGRAKFLGSGSLNLYTTYFQSGWQISLNSGYAGAAKMTGVLEPLEYQNTFATGGATAYQTDVYNSTGIGKTYLSDDKNRTIFVRYCDGTFESYCYNDFSQVTRYRNRNGEVTKKVYDTLGQLLEEHVGLKENSATAVDGYANFADYNRCPTDDIQTSVYAIRKWEYVATGPAKGMVSAEIDFNNNRTNYYYNAAGRLSELKRPADIAGGPRASTLYTYDTNGFLDTVTDPEGNIIDFTYDAVGRQIQALYSDGTSEYTVYGNTGSGVDQVVKTIDRMGSVATYEYDQSNRLVTMVHAVAVRNSSGQETATPEAATTITYQYVNGSDLVWKVTQNGATTEYTYDHRGRHIESKVTPRVGTTLSSSMAYLDNRQFKVTDPYNRSTYFAYDATDGRLIRKVKAAIAGWAPSTQTNAGLLAMSRDTNPNAPYVIDDVVYDALGQVVDRFDARQIQSRGEYDSRGRVTNTKVAFGTTDEARTELIYDAEGNVVERRMPRYFDSSDTNAYQKDREQWTYNGRGLVATHIVAPGSPEAATETYTYDLAGRSVGKTDFGGNVWTRLSDACCDRKTASANPVGHGIITNADAAGRSVHVIQVSDVSTHVGNFSNPTDSRTLSESTAKYDSAGRIIYQTKWLSPRGLVDPGNPPIAGVNGIPASEGHTTQYFYDNKLGDGIGLDSSVGISALKLGTGATGTFNISLANALSKLADTVANGGAGVTFSSSTPGRAVVIVNPEDEIGFKIFDAAGRAIMSGKLNNYRGSGATTLNTLATWKCAVHDATTSLAGFGTVLVSQDVDALGNTTTTWTDGLGRVLRSIDQLGKVTSMTYDTAGNQLSIRDPNNVGADMVYNALGRNIQQTDTTGSIAKTTYDRAGNAVKQTDAKNKDTLIVFDARGRRKSTTDRNNATTTFTYTALSQLASITDAESQTTSYTYDARGLRLTETYPDHTSGSTIGQTGYGMVTFVYDKADRVERKQDQLGDTVAFNYDLVGRLTSRNYRTAANSPSGAIADTDTFTYDRMGRISTAVNGRYSNTVSYTYDPAGRKASESLAINAKTYTTSVEYNSREELTKITLPDNTISERSYHATGVLHQLKLDGSIVSTRTYDDGHRQTGETLGNGVTETRTYANDNLLMGISYGGSGTAIGNLSYTWDANKNKTSETIGGVMSGYGFTSAGTTYDHEDRLTGFARASGSFNQSWSLTSVGDWNSVTTNGTAQTRTNGPTHELVTAAGQNVSSDVKGNIAVLPLSLTNNSSPLALGYDFDNKLNSADTDNNGSADVNFQYDALGRRVARVGSSGSMVFVQLDQQTIADYGYGDNPSSPMYRYVYASYVDEPVVRKGAGSGGSIHYFHRNHQYSIYAITTSTGAVAERYAYTAYGQPTICNASGSPLASSNLNQRYTYTGREWDATVGLYHFRARWMSPIAGRFLGRDPIGYEDGLNTYTMMLNSPLDGSDPFGWMKLCQSYSEKEVFKTPPMKVWKFELEASFELMMTGQRCKKECGCDFAAVISGTISGKMKFKLSGPGAISAFGVPITFKWYGGAEGGVYGSFYHDFCDGTSGYKKCTFIRAFFGIEKSEEINAGPMSGSKISIKGEGYIRRNCCEEKGKPRKCEVCGGFELKAEACFKVRVGRFFRWERCRESKLVDISTCTQGDVGE
jgi:RHS repeat-associated protein